MPAIMRECKMCHKLTPPLSLFKWDSKVEQHNKNFNGKNVCNLCYKILQEKMRKSYKKNKLEWKEEYNI